MADESETPVPERHPEELHGVSEMPPSQDLVVWMGWVGSPSEGMAVDTASLSPDHGEQTVETEAVTVLECTSGLSSLRAVQTACMRLLYALVKWITMEKVVLGRTCSSQSGALSKLQAEAHITSYHTITQETSG